MTLHRSGALTLTNLQDRNDREEREYVFGPEEVGRILDCSPRDVVRLARKGKLRARRMGTRWRFRRDDVLVYLTRLSQIDKSI